MRGIIMSKVYLRVCDSYDEDVLKPVIKDALLTTSFKDIKKGDSVFIKVNCLGGYSQDLAITTNPHLLKVVIDLAKERTDKIMVGDNPANKDMVSALKKNGMYEVIKDANVSLLNGEEQAVITNPAYHTFKDFAVSKQIVDADYLINLPKLKTHTLTYFSCAQKNLFGLIYGLNKSSWHVKAPTPLDFAYVIGDLYGAIKMHFKENHIINLCDGIDALEGEGPATSGSKYHLGAILASNDAISLDRVAIEVSGLDYNKYILGNVATSLMLGISDLDDIQIVGDTIDSFKDKKMREPDKGIASKAMKLLRMKFIRNACLEHPKIDKNICKRCGECANICTSHAMTIKKGDYPHLKSNKCIRCWCCQEICPHHAIKKTKRPLIGKILFK